MATDEQEPTQPAQPVMALWLVLVFQVDGQPVAQMPIGLNLPIPPAGEVGTLHLALDGRELLRTLEPALGPTPASRGGIVLPNGVIPITRKRHD